LYPHNIIFPDDARWKAGVNILKRLQEHNTAAYFVGGCVRDILLGLAPEDYDISTSCRPKEVLKIFPNSDRIGIRYGVIGIKSGQGYKFQIATFRRDDTQSDGRRPKRIFFSDLTGDSARRDFTINAIYLDPINQELADPQHGVSDLEQRVLRIIGNPIRRLREDYLRILRAIRFASRFNLEIEKKSFEAIKKATPLVGKISPDRILDELTRTFLEGERIFALKLLHKTGILAILWDILTEDGEKLYSAIYESFKRELEPSPAGIWTAFFAPWKDSDIPDDKIEQAMQKINLPRKLKRQII